MKKIFTLIGGVAITSALMAQSARNGSDVNYTTSGAPLKMFSFGEKAAGDTLLWMPFPGYYVDPADQPNFDLQTEDLDALTPAQGFPDMDYAFFYSLDPTDFMPTDVDSAFFFGATSWFNPPGQADNWLTFGPVTIPAGGASLSWFVRNNPAFRDGYEVIIGTTGYSNYTDFPDPPIYTRTDLNPNPNDGQDTVWNNVQVNIPASYNGSAIYVAFHHNANDMDVIYFDEFTIVEGAGNVGVEEPKVITSIQNFPNPVRDITTISFGLAETMDVQLLVYDVQGKQVLNVVRENMSAGTQTIQVNAADWAAGTYSYSISAGNTVAKGKMIVVE